MSRSTRANSSNSNAPSQPPFPVILAQARIQSLQPLDTGIRRYDELLDFPKVLACPVGICVILMIRIFCGTRQQLRSP